MSRLVLDESVLLDAIQTESRPCSGGWPYIVSHVLEVNGDKVVGSYYGGPGSPLPMPCLGVEHNGRHYQLLKEEEISIPSLKYQLIQKYLEFLSYPENFESIGL